MRGYQRGIWRREIKAGRAVTGAGTGSTRAPVPRMRCNATPFASWCSAKPGPARWVPALRRTAVEALRRVRDTNVGRSRFSFHIPAQIPDPAAQCARVMRQPCPSKDRGRRESRVRAAPAVSCAVCAQEHAHEHTGSAEASGLPCAMVLRLIARSPRRTGFLATVAPEKPASRELDASIGASGPHAFAVRLSAVRQRHIRVHRISTRVS
jgi:hypothetical protein